MSIQELKHRITDLENQLLQLDRDLSATAGEERELLDVVRAGEHSLQSGPTRTARDLLHQELARTHERLAQLRKRNAALYATLDRVQQELRRTRAELDRAEFVTRHNAAGNEPILDLNLLTERRIREAQDLAEQEAAALPAAIPTASRMVREAFDRHRREVLLSACAALLAVAAVMLCMVPPDRAGADPAGQQPGVRPAVYLALGPLNQAEDRLLALSRAMPQLPADLAGSEVQALLGSTRDQERRSLLTLLRPHMKRQSISATQLPGILGRAAPAHRLGMLQAVDGRLMGPLPAEAAVALTADLAPQERVAALHVLAPILPRPLPAALRDALLNDLPTPHDLRAAAALESPQPLPLW